MSKTVLYALLIALAGLNAFLLYRVRTRPAMVQSATNTGASQKNHDDGTYARLLRGRILLQAKHDPVGLDPQAMVMDTSGRETRLVQIVKSDEMLMFFFTSNHCYSCIDGAIPRLEELAKVIGNDRIALVGQMKEKRDILAFKARYKTPLQIYSVGEDAIISEAKNLNHPFVFLVNKNLKAKAPFFIESDLPEVTDDYMKEVRLHFGH